MFIPEKAIICAPTSEDADLLFQFLGANDYKFGNKDMSACSPQWKTYGIDTCYNIEPDKRTCYCYREYYEREFEKWLTGLADEDTKRYMPHDPDWRFVTVQDFISRCVGCDSIQDEEIEDMISIL